MSDYMKCNVFPNPNTTWYITSYTNTRTTNNNHKELHDVAPKHMLVDNLK